MDKRERREKQEFADEIYQKYVWFCLDSDVDLAYVISKDQFINGGMMEFIASEVCETSEIMAVLSAKSIAELYGRSVDELKRDLDRAIENG